MKNQVSQNQVSQNPEYSSRLFWSSSTTIISVYSAWHNELYFGLARSIIVLLTSLLYWSNPIDGFRRKTDMVCANGFISYQLLVTAQDLPLIARTMYTASAIACILCYINARSYGRRKHPDFDLASKWHMLIHIFGNMGNLILFDGVGKKYISWNVQ